jgi:hypothetical protein
MRFRHLLEAHQLTAQMFDAVRDLLVDGDLLLTTGTIVDATLIAAPSSTKNATTTRDPEMRQTRKGAYWKEADRVAYEAAGGQYRINQRGVHPFHVVKVL